MAKPKLRQYGPEGTIHGTQHLDVEVNEVGEVVAVWFRCQALPFKQSLATKNRSESMKEMYKDYTGPKLHGVIVEDRND